MNFLTEKTVSAQDVLRKPVFSELEELCREIGYPMEKDTDFEAELYRIYFTSFFSTMRKSKKVQEDRYGKD